MTWKADSPKALVGIDDGFIPAMAVSNRPSKTASDPRRDAILYASSACLCIVALITRSEVAWVNVGLVLAASFICAAAAQFRNPFHMMWMCGHMAFCVMPMVVLQAAGYQRTLVVPAVLLLFTIVALVLTRQRRPAVQIIRTADGSSSVIFLAVTIVAQIILIATQGVSFVYLTPLVIIYFASAVKRVGRVAAITLYVLVLSYMLTHIIWFWGEFGRTLIAGVLLVPTLILLYRMNLDILKWPVLLSTAFGALLGTLIRSDESTSLRNVAQVALNDSAVGPLMLTQQIMDSVVPHSVPKWGAWWDQVVLFFVGVFPRIWWPDKPFGFGFQYVLENFPQSYIDAGHNVATTLIGEHLYYLGIPMFVFGSLLAVLLVCSVYLYAGRLKSAGGEGALIVCLYLPTFYWGGLASFSHRFLFGFIVFLVVVAATTTLQWVAASVRGHDRPKTRRS